jgi:hypothetical protein
MLARTTAVLSACSAAVVILVSAGVSASFELNQVRTTPYGWRENSCGSGNAMPGDCISTKGQAQRFRANISSDGSFEHPTTLAVAAQCLQGRRACPITRSGYLRSGDLVFVPDLGWFRVEDTCGACEAGRANAGAIALWTATASATGIQPGQLEQSRPTIQVFHPEEPIPDALKRLKANPDVWQPLVWTDLRHMTGANATSLFVDRHLKRIPASAPARSATPAKTTARPRDATRPTERVDALPGHLPVLPDPLAGRGRSEPTRPQAGARRAGTVLAVDPQERTLTVDEFGANAERRALRVQVPRDALVLVSKRNQSARDLKDAFRESSISLADIREGDFVVVELSADPEVARLVMVTLRRGAGS